MEAEVAQRRSSRGDVDECPYGLVPEAESELFASLRRSGQRQKAEHYVKGLLETPGRKTLGHIAAHLGGPAAQQSLHHFISESLWEWAPLRHALARQARMLLGHDAWVVRPMVIPKAGAHSIGVDLQFVPHLGRAVNGQQAVGVWLASERSAVPVEWQLVLPRRWREEPLRRRARIPAGVRADCLEECVREATAQAARGAGPHNRPVIVDAQGADAVAIARRLGADGHQFVIRTEPATRLSVDRSVLPAYGARERGAGELVAHLGRMRTPAGPGPDRPTASVIPVVAPASVHGGALRGLHLMGEGGAPDGGADRLWLTNATGVAASALLRLTRLSDLVARDAVDIGDRVGLRDFAGRSFSGWHRHITLASIAHFATVLATEPSPCATAACKAA
ncbi:IS701 family transposase [Streptomyces capillispiralis]|uniref:IS701 family transposase n=1 Tax=Streptomyces capillispiralis TaxID=68182 RepID=UPI0036820B1C